MKRVKTHSCEKELEKTDKWMSSFNMPGDKWRCSCGKEYVYDEDEASGGSWYETGLTFLKSGV